MNKREEFFMDLNAEYDRIWYWKDIIERNKNSYSKEDLEFQLGVLQSLRGQLKYFGGKAWEEVEKNVKLPELKETYEKRYERVNKIIKIKNVANKNYDEYVELMDELTTVNDNEKKEALTREIGFYADALKANNYKFEQVINGGEREKIKDLISVLDTTNSHNITFDPYKIDSNRHIVLKTPEELDDERDAIITSADSAFNRFEQVKKEGTIKLLNVLYDSYIEDADIAKKIETKQVARKRK